MQMKICRGMPPRAVGRQAGWQAGKAALKHGNVYCWRTRNANRAPSLRRAALYIATLPLAAGSERDSRAGRGKSATGIPSNLNLPPCDVVTDRPSVLLCFTFIERPVRWALAWAFGQMPCSAASSHRTARHSSSSV